ncbi:MAG: hypothetical protein ACOX7R_11145 [Acetivibrionales bacterium]|jgi:hypothetical protein
MFINWIIGLLSKRKTTHESELYPMVFSIHQSEIDEFINWMRNHSCNYTKNSHVKKLLSEYTNQEIIANGLVSAVFEEYGDETHSKGNAFSITLFPTAFGTEYKLNCSCGEVFEPSYSKEIKSKTA